MFVLGLWELSFKKKQVCDIFRFTEFSEWHDTGVYSLCLLTTYVFQVPLGQKSIRFLVIGRLQNRCGDAFPPTSLKFIFFL